MKRKNPDGQINLPKSGFLLFTVILTMIAKKMVSGTGIEPVLPKEADFKSAASAYSATRTTS